MSVFLDMGTQWNVGPVGVIGLRYESLPVVMRLRGVEPARRRGVFDDLRVMESEALKALRKEKPRD